MAQYAVKIGKMWFSSSPRHRRTCKCLRKTDAHLFPTRESAERCAKINNGEVEEVEYKL